MKKYISTEKDVLRKILSNLRKNGECLEYTGSINGNGYGRVRIGGREGKLIQTHRFVYAKTIGNIPEGIFVCHSCDNPPCCNPDHLFLGTHVVNMADMAKKKRAHRTIGEKSGMCKLTTKQVEAIRKDKRKQIDIAKEYRVAKSTISMIKNFKTRKDG